MSQAAPRDWALLRAQASLIERSRFFDERLALRRDRDSAIQMRQRAVEISGPSRKARRKQARGRIVGSLD